MQLRTLQQVRPRCFTPFSILLSLILSNLNLGREQGLCDPPRDCGGPLGEAVKDGNSRG